MDVIPNKAQAYDINKDFSNIALRMAHDFPAFCAFDVAEEFDGAELIREQHVHHFQLSSARANTGFRFECRCKSGVVFLRISCGGEVVIVRMRSTVGFQSRGF